MFRRLRIPWPQMVLLVLTIAGVVRLHVSLLAAALISVMWMFTLWLDWIRPDHSADPFVIAERPDLDLVVRTAMAAVIAQVEVPLVLVHGHTILVANAAAQSALGPHIIGQDARVALRHPAAVALLGKADGGSTTVRGLTGARSQWQLTRRRIGAENRGPQYWMIELRDRNAEADISRAHTDFVANASHELRTPLSSIIGYVETLAEAPGQFDAATTGIFWRRCCARRGVCKAWCPTSCRCRSWKPKSTMRRPTASRLPHWWRGSSVNSPMATAAPGSALRTRPGDRDNRRHQAIGTAAAQFDR